MASPKKLAHVVFRTGRLPEMLDWYCTVLEARVAFANDFVAFITYDEEHHRLGIVNIAGLHAADAKSWGLAHVAYTFRNIGELLSMDLPTSAC